MNVYEMFVENNRLTSFWIQRNTWGNICAKVVAVGELKGNPPYYGNPKVHVDIYDLKTGELKEARALLSCPGNYTYKRIVAPLWSIALTF